MERGHEIERGKLMTRIKCRYLAAICNYHHGKRCNHYGYFGECEDWESPTNDYCEDESCASLVYVPVQFEKTVESYEYDETGLTIGSEFIDIEDIKYLEIDGVVMIDEVLDGEER